MDRTGSLKLSSPTALLGHLNLLGITPAQSSQALGWRNLSAILLPFWGTLPPLSLPALVEEDQILVQLSNRVRLEVRIGAETFSVPGTPGTFSTLPNHVPTSWQIQDGSTSMVILSIRHDFLARLALEVLDIDPINACLVGKVSEDDPFIYQVSQLILGEIQAPGVAGELLIEALTQSLVIHLLRHHTVFSKTISSVKGKLSPRALQAVLEYIDASLDNSLTLEKLAAIAHLSAFHFSRLFKQSMCIPVHQYVLQRRLETGRDLLAKGGVSITEVALRTGFADASHFCRHFKQHYGITPRFLTK